ncbi:hypothetical protein HY285_03420 [Candidatus Peregrinibacteria bacterium]|nr:hypothetical protein [Candidatus Peregrinibacteria bacterium]MBI3816565.1 hypothetical protein [Candidatus Peregrinibacteria bacterium]
MSPQTSYLYATPTFLQGMAITLDVGATLEQYNLSRTPEEADTKAMRADWRATGNDIRFAMKQHEQADAQ